MAELAIAAIIITLDSIVVDHVAPPPHTYIAAFAVFIMLSIISSFGESEEKFAMYMGGLTVLVIALNRVSLFTEIGKFFNPNQTGGAGGGGMTHK